MQKLITRRSSEASNTPSEATVALRVSRAERDDLVRLAKAHDRTLSSEIRRAIRFYLNNFDLVDRALRDQSMARSSSIDGTPR
jgi:hypothetical protein